MELLVDRAHNGTGPLVARLFDLVEEYEAGNFARGWGDVLPEAIGRELDGQALIALMRVFHYLNELIRVAFLTLEIEQAQRDSRH